VLSSVCGLVLVHAAGQTARASFTTWDTFVTLHFSNPTFADASLHSAHQLGGTPRFAGDEDSIGWVTPSTTFNEAAMAISNTQIESFVVASDHTETFYTVRYIANAPGVHVFSSDALPDGDRLQTGQDAGLYTLHFRGRTSFSFGSSASYNLVIPGDWS